MDEAEFTSSVYLTVTGINIGENMFMQMNRGKEISKSSLLEGDLLFFDWDINGIGEKIPDLVGIYVGNNEFIHLTGDNLSTDEIETSSKVQITKLNRLLGPKFKSLDYYVLKAVRIIQDDGTYFNTDKDTKELADL